MKHFIICLIILLAALGGVAAAQEFNIRNPYLDEYVKSHALTVKPRDAQTVAAEEQLCVEAAQAIIAYVKEHGVDEAAAEITKGKDGAFANYHQIGPQFRYQIFQFLEKNAEGEALLYRERP